MLIIISINIINYTDIDNYLNIKFTNGAKIEKANKRTLQNTSIQTTVVIITYISNNCKIFNYHNY